MGKLLMLVWGAFGGFITRILGWVFGPIVLKLVSSVFMFFGVQALISYMFSHSGFLPDWLSETSLTDQKNGVQRVLAKSGTAWQWVAFMVDYMQVPFAITIALNAIVTRFMIRRIFK